MYCRFTVYPFGVSGAPSVRTLPGNRGSLGATDGHPLSGQWYAHPSSWVHEPKMRRESRPHKTFSVAQQCNAGTSLERYQLPLSVFWGSSRRYKKLPGTASMQPRPISGRITSGSNRSSSHVIGIGTQHSSFAQWENVGDELVAQKTFPVPRRAVSSTNVRLCCRSEDGQEITRPARHGTGKHSPAADTAGSRRHDSVVTNRGQSPARAMSGSTSSAHKRCVGRASETGGSALFLP